MDIGKRLQQARTSAGLTQEQVADALAVTRQTVSNWENGKTVPDVGSIVDISSLYHISLDDLLKARNPLPAVAESRNHLAKPLLDSHRAQAQACLRKKQHP